MDVLIMVTMACATTLGSFAVFRRKALGGGPGSLTSALLGAGLGTYMVSTVNISHSLDNYLFWVATVSGGVASSFLLISHYMLGNEWADEDDPSMFEEASHGTHGSEGADPYAVESRFRKAA
jgi:hypothetical protein